MSALLVSLCNVRKPSTPALLAVDTDLTRVAQVPESTLFGIGATGLAISDRFIFAVTQVSIGDHRARSGLITFDRASLKVVSHYQFERGVDVHSLHLSGETLYAVSTGTDEVLRLMLSGASVTDEKVHWRPADWASPTDARHLNSITSHGGQLLVSGFGTGLKHEHAWQPEPKGFIQDIESGAVMSAGLTQPHSILSIDDSLLLCESGRTLVRCLCGTVSGPLPGYTRGLCYFEDRVYVGTSGHRKAAPSADSATLQGRCTISSLDPASLAIDRTLDLSGYAEEIYDLLPLPGAVDWARLRPVFGPVK